MTEVSFVVEGPVIPKGRARSCSQGHHYTPKRSRAFETRVRWLALEARNRFEKEKRGKWPLLAKGSYALVLTVHEQKSKGRDLDNILKSISDAMNGILYPDDRLVDEVHIERFRKADADMTIVTVKCEAR